MLHVLIGEDDALGPVEKSAKTGDLLSWIVPKKASPGDRVTLFFPSCGFVGLAQVESIPEPASFRRRNAYAADIGEIVLLGRRVTLETVAEAMPEWAWTTYPRSYTTIEVPLSSKLLSLLGAKSTVA